jgi:hypothetical protein
MSPVVRFHRTGGSEVLQIDEIDLGSPCQQEGAIIASGSSAY